MDLNEFRSRLRALRNDFESNFRPVDSFLVCFGASVQSAFDNIVCGLEAVIVAVPDCQLDLKAQTVAKMETYFETYCFFRHVVLRETNEQGFGSSDVHALLAVLDPLWSCTFLTAFAPPPYRCNEEPVRALSEFIENMNAAEDEYAQSSGLLASMSPQQPPSLADIFAAHVELSWKPIFDALDLQQQVRQDLDKTARMIVVAAAVTSTKSLNASQLLVAVHPVIGRASAELSREVWLTGDLIDRVVAERFWGIP